MKIRRMLKKIPWWCKYALVFCVAELLAVIAYKPLLRHAMTYRTSDAPGGEMLLVLLAGFIAVMFALNLKDWKGVRSSGKRSRKNLPKSRVQRHSGRSF